MISKLMDEQELNMLVKMLKSTNVDDKRMGQCLYRNLRYGYQEHVVQLLIDSEPYLGISSMDSYIRWKYLNGSHYVPIP